MKTKTTREPTGPATPREPEGAPPEPIVQAPGAATKAEAQLFFDDLRSLLERHHALSVGDAVSVELDVVTKQIRGAAQVRGGLTYTDVGIVFQLYARSLEVLAHDMFELGLAQDATLRSRRTPGVS